MKNRKVWKRIGVLTAVFILAVIVSSLITNRGSADLTVDMGMPTLPRVKFMIGDSQVNALVGYYDEMDVTAMRDTITPVGDDFMLDMVLERNDNSIDRISYEVCSIDGQTVTKEGTAKEANGLVRLNLEGALEGSEEGVLKVTLSIGDRNVNYYTRIVASEGLNASECLSFAQSFHTNALNKETDFINGYLEPDETGDNNTFQTVTIHSDVFHVIWGNLNPQTVSDVEWDVKESNSAYTSILARYQVTCDTSENEGEVYNIREFFRIRKYKDEIFLLDYQRTMNQVFDGNAQVLNERGITLGLAPADIQYMTNTDGTIVSFVQERDLWTYNQQSDELSLVFSFSNTEGNDIRNWYDQHRVRILNVEDDGSTTFAVYGYMNRGKHEGRVGVNIYYFSLETNAVEEMAFIPSNKSFAIAEDELGHMVYYDNESGLLHILTGGTFYEVDLQTNRQRVLADQLEEGQYAVSEDGHLLAYQTNGSLHEATEISVLNLKTGKDYTVTCQEGECIQPLGFINEDFIYGLAKTSDIGKTVSGKEVLPMYQLEIRDSNNEVVKTYQSEGMYISDVIVEDDMVTVDRVTANEGIYIGTAQDYITNNEEEEESNISLTSFNTEIKERQMRLLFEEGIQDREPKILKPKLTLRENVSTIAFDSEMQTMKYYVYGMGELAGVYDKASYAIQKAESTSGVVISSGQTYIWEKGNRDLSYDTGTAPFQAGDKSSLEACQEYMQQFDAEEVDLSGCTIEQVLYIINKGLPVIAMLNQNQAVLLTAYGSNAVTYIDPATGGSNTVTYDQMNQMAAMTGYTFIGYVQ